MKSPAERHRAILDSTPSFAIVATNAGGIVTDWNRGAEAVLGWSEAEMVGRPVSALFTHEDRDAGRPEAERRTACAEGRAGGERWHLARTARAAGPSAS